MIDSLNNLVLFSAGAYLLISSRVIKCKWRILAHAVEWTSAQSMRIVQTDQIKYLVWRRGPDLIWFRATDEAGLTYEIRLELRISNIQSFAEIIRKMDASYEGKLISKKPVAVNI